ncbi:MAG: hypothetical protein HUJ98_03545 [Bacteroidaceae bacterium]|nr:hypothetical protein [Bacteroidaceae bacterium]
MLEKTYNKIMNLQPTVANAFDQWLNHGVNPDLSIEGYTFMHLVSKMNMQPIGAFLTLDWLMRDPDKAKLALTQGVK